MALISIKHCGAMASPIGCYTSYQGGIEQPLAALGSSPNPAGASECIASRVVSLVNGHC